MRGFLKILVTMIALSTNASWAVDCQFANTGKVDLTKYEMALAGAIFDFQRKVDERNLEFSNCTVETTGRGGLKPEIVGWASYFDGDALATCSLFYDLSQSGRFDTDSPALDCD